MEDVEFRILDVHDADMVRDLIVSNNAPFDDEIPQRVLKSSVPSKARIIGSFDKNELVGMNMAYAFKLCFCGIVKDGAVVTFNMVDKNARKKGIGKKQSGKIARLIKESGFDFVTAYINAKLVGKWSDAIDASWATFGYETKKLRMLTPCFRMPGAKLPETSINELPDFQVKRLSHTDMDAVLRHAESFLARYYIAEMPDENAVRQLDLFPDKYLWYSISRKDRQMGYVSGYVFHDRKKDGGIQNKLVFENLMVDEIYLPGAINAVIGDLEKNGFEYDLYVINNSSLINNLFLYRSAFNPGFSRFQTFLRCYSQDKHIMEIFHKIDSAIPFSLPIL